LAADRPVYLYVECDGMVKLVPRAGRLAFPREGEVDLPLEFKGQMDFPEGKVLFAVPLLDEWPRDWVFKDDVPGLPDVEPLVRRAINASLVREVVGALVFHPDDWPSSSPRHRGPDDWRASSARGRGPDSSGRILLVKASRGFTKGTWNVPGGFVTYGEPPEESMRREMLEETGLPVRLDRLLGVFTQKFQSPYFMRGHMYAAHALGTALKLKPDEIAEAQWFPLDEARRLLMNPFARKALGAWDQGRGLLLE
jgi:ADP-ribose pyrophosphatase YjhB (NUDIX family)